MAYADFDYYVTTYLGTEVTSTNFARLSARASVVIDRLTFNRAAAVTDVDDLDKIKMAMCSVMDEMLAVESDGEGIKSESIGSSSVTYAEGSNRLRDAESRYEDAARFFLDTPSLMYRGFASGEYSGESADAD